MNIQNIIRHIVAKKYTVPQLEKAAPALERFSVTEKLIFGFFFVLAGIASVVLLFQVNKSFLVAIPTHGGTLIEGIVGLPRFINPLLAISDADKDLAALVYSGLMKATPTGELVADLAESMSISPDGKVYTFIIKDNAAFHDGAPVTAKDVAFTIETAKDPLLKSSKRANWEGVEVEVVGEKEIRFILKQPYAPFLENTTLGILPKHAWKNATADQFAFSNFNIYPVGSGPYAVESVKRDGSGLPIRYSLKSVKRYDMPGPYINRIVISFYANEEELVKAYRKGAIEAINGISPNVARAIESEGGQVLHTPLPRVFGVFFNQNQQSLFTEKPVRQALDISLSKERIINEVLEGYAVAINGPIPTINAAK